jgi:hypothetical protein
MPGIPVTAETTGNTAAPASEQYAIDMEQS